MKKNEILYENGYGGFCQEGTEYIICTKEKTTPLPWSHLLANEKFGTLLTANGGGYVWHGNSQKNKITRWSNDCMKDSPSEMLSVLWNKKKIGLLPYDTLDKYTVIFGFGYAKYICEEEDLKTETIIFVPRKEAKKIYDISITMKKKEEGEKKIKLEYTMIPVLGVAREFTKKHLVAEKEEKKVKIKNSYRDVYANEEVVISFFHEIEMYSFEEKVVKVQFFLEPDETKKEEKSEEEVTYHCMIEVACQEENLLEKEESVFVKLEEVKNFWKETLTKVKVKTPVESMNLMMNGWLIYQTLCCRMWARTSFYQAGGAFGFRDQLQDSLSLLWVDSSLTKQQILLHAAHQFEEGDVLHWWHAENNSGTRTRYTDDLLWLPFVMCQYIDFTQDYSILEEKVPYVKSEVLKKKEEERYLIAEVTSYQDTIYSHVKRAIEYGIKLSENGLPKMNGGDWNDGMNEIKGQSIWLGFFMYKVLELFIPIADFQNDKEAVRQYKDVLSILRSGLNEYGWDGKWYRRAYFENGEPLGSSQNEECKIDGISQSWALISGAGEKEKCEQAMESVDVYLVDKENMIIKLLTPPFDKTSLNPGYIKDYIPGVRENGGQYTHGAIWSVIANAMLKNGERAEAYFRMLNPIEHARTKENAMRYKVEPYVMAADVYASHNMLGRGGWTWYTGSSSWFYLAGLEYLLGLKKRGDNLEINPCIPKEWESFEVEYVFQETKYHVEVKNPSHKTFGITSLSFDNNILQEKEIQLVNDKKEHWIEVKM